jgi:hypothetical protein
MESFIKQKDVFYNSHSAKKTDEREVDQDRQYRKRQKRLTLKKKLI